MRELPSCPLPYLVGVQINGGEAGAGVTQLRRRSVAHAALADAQLAQSRATEGAHLRSSEGLQGGGKSVARGRQGVSKEL